MERKAAFLYLSFFFSLYNFNRRTCNMFFSYSTRDDEKEMLILKYYIIFKFSPERSFVYYVYTEKIPIEVISTLSSSDTIFKY